MIKMLRVAVRLIAVFGISLCLQYGIWDALYAPIQAPALMFVIVSLFTVCFFFFGYSLSDSDRIEEIKLVDEHASHFMTEEQIRHLNRRLRPPSHVRARTK